MGKIMTIREIDRVNHAVHMEEDRSENHGHGWAWHMNDLVEKISSEPSTTIEVKKQSATIEKVIFNEPATIILWADGSKTVVKAKNEAYDPEKGLAMALVKKLTGNEGKYYDVFRKWLPKRD